MTKADIIKEEYYKNPQFNRRHLAQKLGVRESYIRRIIRPLKKNVIEQGHKPLEEKIEFNNTSKNNATLELESLTITTLEQALEVAKVDMTQWKVDRYQIGSWQVTLKLKDESGKDYPKTVTMYKIQVWLRKLHNMEWVESIRSLIHEIPKLKTPKKDFKLDGQYLLEISLADTHFGLLAWGKESGYDYDIDIAEELYLYAVQDLLSKASGYKPSRILISLGNDLFHINDHTNQTPTSHNVLDVDSRLIKIYQKAKIAVIKAIEYSRRIAPVDIIWVPGNHDPFLSYYLTDCISHIFSDDENVNVDVSPRTRKYYKWFNNLIVFTHGVDEPMRDLPSIIATEEPQLWSESLYRECHIGHKHKKTQFTWNNVDTKHGIVVKMIPSIAANDAWHTKKGYVKNYHAAQSFIYDKNALIAEFTSYVDPIYRQQKL